MGLRLTTDTATRQNIPRVAQLARSRQLARSILVALPARRITAAIRLA